MSEAKNISDVLERSREFSQRLSSLFVGRKSQVECMMVAAIAQEPLLFLGSPGTGKSELITQFKTLLELDEKEYFEYTLTKFTEPSEILGPLDLQRMKEGEFFRRTEGKLPRARLAFLDEVFKANSAILNTLLTILNERKFYQDGRPMSVPLKVLFAATNEIPEVSELDALKDRFTLKVKVDRVSEDLWSDLIRKGLSNELARYFNRAQFSDRVFAFEDLEFLHNHLEHSFQSLASDGEDPYFSSSLKLEFKRILKHMMHEFDMEISDRKIIKIYKMIRARALFMRGGGVEREDFSLLIHLGNNSREMEFLRDSLPDILG